MKTENLNYKYLQHAVLALVVVYITIIQFRVVNYVCGNDPMYYIRAARVLLRPGFYGTEAVRHALTFVAPGYPLLLTLLIAIFGDLVPYWSNFIILAGCAGLLYLICKELMRSERAAMFSTLLWPVVILGGQRLHAPFLLYPFRETPRLFLVLLAYVLLLRSRLFRSREWIMPLVASVAMMGAVMIREPSGLILPGLLIGIMLLSVPFRQRVRCFCVFLVPWLIAAFFVCLVLQRVELISVSQFSVVHYLGNHDVALMRINRMLPWFHVRLGWPAFLLILAGIFRALFDAKVLLAWFLVPAGTFFVFYAYMQMHDRYFLTTLVFLAVFAGYGLDLSLSVFEWCLCRFNKLRAVFPVVRVATTCFGILFITYGMLHSYRSVVRWGPRVKAAEIRQWQQNVRQLESGADGRIRVAVEQRCRYLEDMLLSYTDVELLDPKNIDDWPEGWSPAHYFKPMNRQALYETPQWLMYLKIFAHRIMADQMNIEHSGMDDFYIGQGRYRHYHISQWQSGLHQQYVDVDTGRGNVLWFDWGAACPESVRFVRIYCGNTDEVIAVHEKSGNGIQAVYLSAGQVPHERLRVEIESNAPVPASPVIAVVQDGQFYSFTLGVDRVLSSNRILTSRRDDYIEPHFLRWRSRRELGMVIPPLISTEDVNMLVSVHGKADNADKLYVFAHRHAEAGFVRKAADIERGLVFKVTPGESVELFCQSSDYPAVDVVFVVENLGFMESQD